MNRNETFGSGGATSQHKHDFSLINTVPKKGRKDQDSVYPLSGCLGYSHSDGCPSCCSVLLQMLPLVLANLAWHFLCVCPTIFRPHHFHTPPWNVGDNGIGQVNCPGSAIFHCIFCIFGVKFMLHLANLMPFFHNINGEGLQLNAEGTDMICVAICIN